MRNSERMVRSALERVSAENLAAIRSTAGSNAVLEAARQQAAAGQSLAEEAAKTAAKLRSAIDDAAPAVSEAARTTTCAVRSVDRELAFAAKSLKTQQDDVETAINQATTAIERHLTEIERIRQRLFSSDLEKATRKDSSVSSDV